MCYYCYKFLKLKKKKLRSHFIYTFLFFTCKTVSFSSVWIWHLSVFHPPVKPEGPVRGQAGAPGARTHCAALAWRPDSYPPRDQEGGAPWWEAKRPVSQRKRLRLLENNAWCPCGWATGTPSCFLARASVEAGPLDPSKRHWFVRFVD